MGGYEELIAGIKAVVRRNGRREITGDALQQVLVGMVSAIGANSAFAGVATPDTDPGSPDANVFWIAATPGTYAHFGNAAVTASAILSNETGEWVATPLNFGNTYKPFPEFSFSNGKNSSIDRDNYLYYFCTYDLHFYGAAQYGLDDVKLEFYRYKGESRNGLPYEAVYTVDLSGLTQHVHGRDIVVELPLNSMDLLWHLGLRGSSSAAEVIYFRQDVEYFINQTINGRIDQLFKEYGPIGGLPNSDRKYRGMDASYHSKLKGPPYIEPGRFAPLVTMRCMARLSRGNDVGPMTPFRIGIYSMKKPGGDSGIATSDKDYFIKVGYIQKIDKAYRY